MRHLKKAVALVAGVGVASHLLPGGAQAQELAQRYAVKFVCGLAEGRILAPGDYKTAINIQNPNHDPNSEPVKIRKRYSVASPSETVGGTTPFLGANELGPGEAYEIDCPDILDSVRDFCPDGLCKGFVTIEGNADLEIVAVYSAADLDAGSVRSIHTERVTGAGSCPIQTQVVEAQSLLFVPPHVRGDREFDGHGPCVRFELDLRTQDQGTALVASYFMHAFECDSSDNPQHDFTAAEGRRQTVLFAASPRSRILGYNVTSRVEHSYRDTDHAADDVPGQPNDPVSNLQFVGDTSGDEAGTKTRVKIDLREIQLRLENCGLVDQNDG